MEPKHRDLPIGFRFRPSDCELSSYFLKKKVFGQTMKTRTVPEECHDIFSRHPRDLPGKFSPICVSDLSLSPLMSNHSRVYLKFCFWVRNKTQKKSI